jgi:hypothetical protein
LAKNPKHSSAPRRLRQVPEKLTDLFDKDLLQLIDIERFSFDHMIPRNREELEAPAKDSTAAESVPDAS